MVGRPSYEKINECKWAIQIITDDRMALTFLKWNLKKKKVTHLFYFTEGDVSIRQ
jgi:hypothetical protein